MQETKKGEVSVSRFIEIFPDRPFALFRTSRGPGENRKLIWVAQWYAGYFTSDTDRFVYHGNEGSSQGFGDTPEEALYDLVRIEKDLRKKTEEPNEKKKINMSTVMQPWTFNLGLRHQGILLAAVRGCDLIPKGHVSKSIVRALRSDILNSFCVDPKKAASFIEVFSYQQFIDLTKKFLYDLDPYPVHYLLHLTHAAEILGYKHPTLEISDRWRIFYFGVVRKFHMKPETEADLDKRLNATEEEFKESQEILEGM